MRAKVSIIIPVYNEERYLRECLDSVLAQTLRPIEVLCVDDGSSDNSLSILNQYAKKYNFIKVHKQKNLGSGTARNYGIKNASGEFIAFMDSDDRYPDNRVLEDLYHNAKNNKLCISGGSMSYMDENGNPLDFTLDSKNAKQVLQEEGIIDYKDYQFEYGYYRFIFDTEMLQNNNILFPPYRRFQDPPFFIRAMIQGGQFYALTRPTYLYRKGHREVVWNEEKVVGLMDGLKDNLKLALDNEYFELADRTMSRIVIDYSGIIRTELYNGSKQAKERMDYYIQSAKQYPMLSRYVNQLNKICDEATFAEIQQRKMLPKDNNPIKVSIIMPSLNVAPYIRECIESAINQTMKDIEIICVDAGSTDGTLEILQEYATRDNRITIINSPVKSYGYQMNLGLDRAQGQYFAILETDDWMKPFMLEELYEYAESNYLDFVKSDRSSFVGDGDKREFTYLAAFGPMELRNNYGKVLNPQVDRVAFMAHNLTQPGLYKLSFIKGNKIRYHETPGASYQDNGFWFLSMCHAKRIMIIEKDYYQLRRDNPNSSVKSSGKVYCICDEYDYIRSKLSESPALEKEYSGLCAYNRFKNYEWTYGRVADCFKEEFLQRFVDDFKLIEQRGEIQAELYNMEESFRLRMLLENPISYKYHREAVDNREYNTKFTYGQRKTNSADVQEELNRVKFDLDSVHKSVSFRVGRMLTSIPRFLRDSFKGEKTNNRVPVFTDAICPKTINKDMKYFLNLTQSNYYYEIIDWYQKNTGMPLDYNFPETLTQKLQWLKLYGNTDLIKKISGNLEAKEWLKEQIGEDRILPAFGSWKSFDDVDFDSLPTEVVFKTNHLNYSLVFKRGKSEFDKAKDILNSKMGINGAFAEGYSLNRLNVEPSFYAEEYFEGNHQEYHVVSFNGKPTALWIYNQKDGKMVPASQCMLEENVDQEKIQSLGLDYSHYLEMIDISGIISKSFSFIDTCFIILNGKIYVDRIEFAPNGGIDLFIDYKDDAKYGAKLKLPIKSPIPKRRD